MSVVAVVLAFVAVGAIAVVGAALALVHSLVKRVIAKTDAAAEARVEDGTKAAELKLANFQIEQWKAEAGRKRRLAAQLAEALRNALAKKSVGDGLADDDVDGRILRLYEAEAEADAEADGDLPAIGNDGVSRGGRGAVAEGEGAAREGEAPAPEVREP